MDDAKDSREGLMFIDAVVSRLSSVFILSTVH